MRLLIISFFIVCSCFNLVAQNSIRVHVCKNDYFSQSKKDVNFYMVIESDTIQGIKDTANTYLFSTLKDTIKTFEYIFETDKFVYNCIIIPQESNVCFCYNQKICVRRIEARKRRFLKTYNLDYYCSNCGGWSYVFILHENKK